MTQQNGFDTGPIDGLIHFFKGFETSIVFQGFFHDQIGEGKGLVQSFKSYNYPPVGFL